MSAATLRRLVLSAVIVVSLGAAMIALAAAGGTLRMSHARPSLTVAKTPAARLPIRGMAPGDRAERVAVIRNRGAKPIRRVRFELTERPVAPGRPVAAPRGRTTPTGYRWVRTCTVVTVKRKRVRRCRTVLQRIPSALVTDRNGLRVTVESCPTPWQRLAGPAPAYRCPKRSRVLLRDVRLPTRRVLTRLPRIAPRGRAYLRTTIRMPITAGNNLQGASADLIPRYVVLAGGR